MILETNIFFYDLNSNRASNAPIRIFYAVVGSDILLSTKWFFSIKKMRLFLQECMYYDAKTYCYNAFCMDYLTNILKLLRFADTEKQFIQLFWLIKINFWFSTDQVLINFVIDFIEFFVFIVFIIIYIYIIYNLYIVYIYYIYICIYISVIFRLSTNVIYTYIYI